MAKRVTSYLKLVASRRDPDPEESWPGVADINRAGLALAVEMLEQLESCEDDEHGVRLTDYACLEDWPRQGRPFRNVVAEYLSAARKDGPQVEAGFCAVLSDTIALHCSGMVPDSARYYGSQFAGAATT
jgi:hypothetical protein